MNDDALPSSDPQSGDAGDTDADVTAFEEAPPRARIGGRSARVPAVTTPQTPEIVEFGEEAYREAYPDIHVAINAGALDSAAGHFRRHGRQENRLRSAPYLTALVGTTVEHAAGNVPLSIDAAIMADNGTMLVIGWIDDRACKLRSVSIIQGFEGANTRAFGRCRRPDVDTLLNSTTGYAFGFWLVLQPEWPEMQRPSAMIRTRLYDGGFEQREVQFNRCSDVEMRETVMGHFARLEYFGNRDVEAFANLELGIGDAMIRFNRVLSGAITSSAHAEYFGPRRSRYKASLIICLFGKVEYFFLQNALFSNTVGIEDYEFIYVSNSPEMAETLHKEARVASIIYGHSVIVVTLPGNAGFSAANNAAARFARSDRLVFVNPDIFPRDRLWAEKHEALIETQPRERTALFGALLYYDDGSLMHGGMHFAIDLGLSVRSNAITPRGMVRVEHYGKGAPAWSDRYTHPRPVPAVTGAFISIERDWFQTLGGFTEDYIFGHYEDADLCLKSLRQGIAAWMHDLRFWHLEGKGSTRRPPHEGGSLVNRWLFTRRWGDLIKASMSGPHPTHKLLQVDVAAAAPEPQVPEPPPEAPPPVELPPEPPAPGAPPTRAKRSSRAMTGVRNG